HLVGVVNHSSASLSVPRNRVRSNRQTGRGVVKGVPSLTLLKIVCWTFLMAMVCRRRSSYFSLPLFFSTLFAAAVHAIEIIVARYPAAGIPPASRGALWILRRETEKSGHLVALCIAGGNKSCRAAGAGTDAGASTTSYPVDPCHPDRP